jgi:2-oxoglutarate dehydrogenase E2 component (dihydrolipoamide succinyltransferase)
MSRLRQRVAERLVQSQSTAAILTTFNEVNMAPVIELRNRYKERFEKEHGVKLGFMGFFVKAAVHALKKFPAVNASIDGHRHHLSRLFRHRHRRRQPARTGGADPA